MLYELLIQLCRLWHASCHSPFTIHLGNHFIFHFWHVKVVCKKYPICPAPPGTLDPPIDGCFSYGGITIALVGAVTITAHCKAPSHLLGTRPSVLALWPGQKWSRHVVLSRCSYIIYHISNTLSRGIGSVANAASMAVPISTQCYSSSNIGHL